MHWIGRWVLGRDFYSEFFGSFVMQMEATWYFKQYVFEVVIREFRRFWKIKYL